jgi:hypothetical protein
MKKIFPLILLFSNFIITRAAMLDPITVNDDDKLNPILANEYGAVIGTSHHEPLNTDYTSDYAWGQSVASNIKIFKTPLVFNKTGKHTINYWMINPGVVLQKLVLDLGELKPSI